MKTRARIRRLWRATLLASLVPLGAAADARDGHSVVNAFGDTLVPAKPQRVVTLYQARRTARWRSASGRSALSTPGWSSPCIATCVMRWMAWSTSAWRPNPTWRRWPGWIPT